jgi:Xaa-Pro dipeptidase
VVVLDFGGAYKGYCSDMTRTVLVEGGTPDPDFEKVYNLVNAARDAGHKQARPGVSCESVDAAARQVITEGGYGQYFVHRTGHGIGMEVHEEPYIVGGNSLPLEPGMAFSIEPGIYLPGRFGVRIEDIAIVTGDGEENINLSTHEYVRVK